jgi:hypothetical protein
MPLSEWLLTAPGAISIGALTTRPLTPGPARPLAATTPQDVWDSMDGQR